MQYKSCAKREEQQKSPRAANLPHPSQSESIPNYSTVPSEDWDDVKDEASKGGTAHNISCYATLADKNTGTFYTDATGALPVQSLDVI